jgi:phage terminase large subunit
MSDKHIELDLTMVNEVYRPYLTDYARTQILFGGSSSGKSVFLAQRVVADVLGGKRNYLILRQVGRTLRGSVYTEIGRVIIRWGLQGYFNVNKSDMMITCMNGYQIIFGGLDDVEKLKSLTPQKGVITDIWVEEATETERDTIKQLYKRQRGGDPTIPKRLILSFNPIIQSHWIYEEYFSTIGWSEEQTEYHSSELSILKTTYKDNRFLTPEDVYDLENERDPYYRDVYTLGKWGVLGNVIFTNWIIANLNDPADPYYLPEAQRTNRRHGLDFGFSSDPAAAPFTHYDRDRKRIYIYDEFYERGLTNDVLAVALKKIINEDYIKCDSSEPKSIVELKQYKLNADGANKGKDSVVFGIQWLQQQTIIIDKSCVNSRNEFSQYKWKEDSSGNAIRQPLDRHNHIIDGLRYAYEDDMLEQHVDYLPGLYR